MVEYGLQIFTLNKLVLGTAGLGGVWKKVEPERSVYSIQAALQAGINWIDTAPAYGDAEEFVGRAIRDWKGTQPMISTKVGRLNGYRSDIGNYDYSPYGIAKSLENSLQLLGRAKVDLLFLHEPKEIPEQDIHAAVKEMVRLKRKGLTNKIGLGGNYPPAFHQYLEDGTFDVVMEYNRLTSCCLDALDTSIPQCVHNNIDYWAASPLHMGLLGRRFAEFTQVKPDWLPEHHIMAAMAVENIASRHQLSLVELSLRFLLHQNIPGKIVIGPCDEEELKEIIHTFSLGPLENTLFMEVTNVIEQINNFRL